MSKQTLFLGRALPVLTGIMLPAAAMAEDAGLNGANTAWILTSTAPSV